MTRYLLIVNFEGGVVDTPMEEWKPEEVTAHLDYYRAAAPGARRQRRAGRRPRSSSAPTWRRSSRFDGADRARRHRRAVPGVQGVGGRLPDRRRRVRGARDRDRRAALGRARAGRRRDAAADPRAADDGRRRRPTPPRWRRSCEQAGGEQLNVSDRASRTCCASSAPQVLGALVRRHGDFDAAEDAVQEALLAAAQHWPRGRASPRARAAGCCRPPTRRLIDQWRSEQSRAERARASRRRSRRRRRSRTGTTP